MAEKIILSAVARLRLRFGELGEITLRSPLKLSYTESIKGRRRVNTGITGYARGASFLFALIIFNPLFIFAKEARNVRVAIFDNVSSVSLSVKGNFVVEDLNTGAVIYKGKNLKKKDVRPVGNKLSIQDVVNSAGPIKVTVYRGELIYINNRSYRAAVKIFLKGSDKLLVVNELNIEDYLKGVVPIEVAHWWPMEALKAQSVIARSYSLYHMQFTTKKDFDFTPDIYSQVYAGQAVEKWRSNRAVDLTRGEVLAFQGSLFPAYYHATCGGITEDAANLWKIDMAPLKSVVCGFCNGSPHYNWEKTIALKDISLALNKNAVDINGLIRIEVLGRNISGRVTELKLISKDGSLNISAKDFRQFIGPNIIRSTNFHVGVDPVNAYFKGVGWGHGVGLCQWGAYFMAENGYNYRQILTRYYPGSELKK